MDPEAAQRFVAASEDTAVAVLNDVDWVNNPRLATSLRNSMATNPALEICVAGSVSSVACEWMGDPRGVTRIF